MRPPPARPGAARLSPGSGQKRVRDGPGRCFRAINLIPCHQHGSPRLRKATARGSAPRIPGIFAQAERAPGQPTARAGSRGAAASEFPRIGMAAGGRAPASVGPASTISPACITITRSVIAAHHGQIVADEQIGQPKRARQLGQQVEDLRPDRHVQRRDRLVQHDQVGLDDQRAGDGDALALAAGELVDVLVGVRGGQADRRQRLGDRRGPRGAGRRTVEQVERLGDQPGDAVARVEAAVGVLEHHLHPPPHRAVRPVAGRRPARRPAGSRPPAPAPAPGSPGSASTCRSRIRRPARRVRRASMREADPVDGAEPAGRGRTGRGAARG